MIVLWGREADQALVARVLGRARAGSSAVLVLRGDPGIGKTALLRQARDAAAGMTVLRCAGVETEAEVPFAALHQLLHPVLGRLDALPPLQADALRAALGLGPAAGGDELLIGVAVLSLLAEVGPVACFVDDAHWLDRASAQALLFAARRLEAEAVALLVATRDAFGDLPHHMLRPLSPDAAAHLIGPVPAAVRDRIVAEAAGNPLALLELPRSGADDRPLPLPERIQQAFAARLDTLPAEALLLAATDDEADLATLVRAGAEMDTLAQAERGHLIEVVDGRVIFTHPLLRAAAYRHATFDRRLAAHRALAGVVDDPDRRAWHLAAAATGPDEEAAAALEEAAERARGRKGYAAAAAALRRAAELSPATGRVARLVAAAEAADAAGPPDQVRALLERLPLDHALALRAKLAFDDGDVATAHDLLLTAAADAPRSIAGPMLFDAARNAWLLGDAARLAEVSRLLHARGLRSAVGLDAALAAVNGTAPPPEGVAAMAELVAEADGLDAAFVAGLIGAFEASRDIAASVAARARAEGAVGRLPRAHATLAAAELHLGRFRDAVATAAEGLQLPADPTVRAELEGVLAWIAAARGEERIAGGADQAWSVWALALLDLGRGRFAEASDRLESALAGPAGRRIQGVYLTPDRAEAALRAGHRGRAEAACARFETWAAACPSPWATAAVTRCRALLSPVDTVPADFPWEAARTHLILGERLRRDRRKTEARTHLRTAADLFDRLGADPWSERARAELRAAGEAIPARAGDSLAALSPQELQIVRLAAAGRTNREIAATLFISPKTVSYHLYRAFPKLNVTSRTQLARLDLN
ncbi:LuxR C-terminal-related transcriptional regulator [Dactylosporangium sp. NPDC049140]|uniref:helix-turn-helix transcriptional regulator n=1 Tax=Dactylosporangium sp. NPDC049140 TaxID=3155647 RepID=UPI0033FBDB36